MQTHYYHVIGVMSGTSLDGIDICEIFFQKNDTWAFKIGSATTIEYSQEWKNKLTGSIAIKTHDLDQLDNAYTNLLASEINSFIRSRNIQNIDAICSHGHTVFHQPQIGLTKQIGNKKELASLTGYRVICDFRTQDVELKGEGAPLVPIGDEMLFGDFDYCLNLGGFSNVSFKTGFKRIAFDICPVNIVLNYYARLLHMDYDMDGEMARQGNLNDELLNSLNQLDYYKLPPPKSLGVEWVNTNFLPLINKFNLSTQDILRTLVEHIAYQIQSATSNKKSATILITGGGAFNSFLTDRIKGLTSNTIVIPSDKIVNYKEALIFGFLGLLKLRNEVNCLSSVTGAIRDHSSGKIFIP